MLFRSRAAGIPLGLRLAWAAADLWAWRPWAAGAACLAAACAAAWLAVSAWTGAVHGG